MAEKTDNVVDFRDSLSSISLLKVTQLFEKMKPAEILEIQGADIDNQQDLFKVLPKMSYEVISSEKVDERAGLYCIRLKKCR